MIQPWHQVVNQLGDCIRVVVISDYHYEGVSWRLDAIVTENGDSLSSVSTKMDGSDISNWNVTSDDEYTNYECIDAPLDLICVNFTIYDDFGDVLMYGRGSWYIKCEFDNSDDSKVDFSNTSNYAESNNYVLLVVILVLLNHYLFVVNHIGNQMIHIKM